MSSAKKIWIIGASAGIGESLAKELAQRGHHVALSARNEEALQSLCEELPAVAGGDHLVVPLDVAQFEQVTSARDHILERWGTFDSVVFMAGLYDPMSLGSLDLEKSETILTVNLLGAFYVVEAVLPTLLAKPKGQQAQLALCASVAGYRGLPNGQPYGASKAGVINLAESLRIEHGKCIDVKVINPGFVETRLTDKNDFAMPMRISSEKAARYIAKPLLKGLTAKGWRRCWRATRFEIHFPKQFTYFLKFLGILPNWIYFRLLRQRG